MKKITVIFVSVALIISTNLFAQDKDHVVLGRLKGSSLAKFEQKNYEKLYIPLGKIENNKFSKLDSIEGEIERRLYEPVKGTTILEVYNNYLNALNQMNAEILYKANGINVIGEGLGDAYYKLNPMMGLVYRNTMPYSFTVVEKTAKSFIAAKLSKNGKVFYINLIIGNGYEPYTMYQLDIVEVKNMEGEIMIVNNNTETVNSNSNITPNNNTPPTNPKTDNKNDDTKSLFSLQLGYTHYKLTSPLLYGGQYFTQNDGINGGNVSGFSELSGIYVQLSYFINQNLSINASYGSHDGENSGGYENDNSSSYYYNEVKISYTRLGITGGITGKKYPVKLSLSTGAGLANIEASFLEESYAGSTNDNSYYEGKSDFVMIYFQTEIVFPIIKGIYIFSEYEYNIGINGDLTMSDNSGDKYKEIKYENPGFGGNVLKIGIGYEFNKNN